MERLEARRAPALPRGDPRGRRVGDDRARALRRDRPGRPRHALAPRDHGLCARASPAGATVVIFSDDLHMKAVSDRWASGGRPACSRSPPAATRLLVCTDPDAQERVRLALAAAFPRRASFSARLRDAHDRVARMRRRTPRRAPAADDRAFRAAVPRAPRGARGDPGERLHRPLTRAGQCAMLSESIAEGHLAGCAARACSREGAGRDGRDLRPRGGGRGT